MNFDNQPPTPFFPSTMRQEELVGNPDGLTDNDELLLEQIKMANDDINKLYSRFQYSLKCVSGDVRLRQDEFGIYFAKETIPGFERRIPADSLLHGFLSELENTK